MFKKHPIITTVCFLLATLLIAMAVTGFLILNYGHTVPTVLPKYMLVLGTTVEGTEPSSMLRDRINAAYNHLTAYPEVICIVSGYKSGNGAISEAQCMYNELTKMGIDPERIWMEPTASSTEENFKFTLDLIEEKTGICPDYLTVVSSEFHMLRASMFAAEQGIRIIPIGATTTDLPTFLFWFIREIFLVWYYAIF